MPQLRIISVLVPMRGLPIFTARPGNTQKTQFLNYFLTPNRFFSALTRGRAVPALHPRFQPPAPQGGTQRAAEIKDFKPPTFFF